MYKELIEWEPEFIEMRHDLHAHPEIGFDTQRTSSIVAKCLEKWGYEVHPGIGKTGVVGQLKLGSGTKSIGLRSDMDALPMDDEAGLPYSSKIPGRSHACGHDGHTVMLLAGARLIAQRKLFDGTVNVIFQPAEEGQGGGSAMVKDGLFKRFPCDYVFGLHNMPHTEGNGLFNVQKGAMFASSDRFIITIKGQGGHGAEPQHTIDPVVIGSAVVQALQSIVSRNTAPKDRVVVSVGSFLAGKEDSFNIIPETATLLLSVRTTDNEVRAMVLDKIKLIATSVCLAYGAHADVVHIPLTHAVINDARAAAIAREAALKVFDAKDCPESFQPYMNSEDFSFMLDACPGAYATLNNGDTPNCHQPNFDFNDSLIIKGASFWTSLVETYLSKE